MAENDMGENMGGDFDETASEEIALSDEDMTQGEVVADGEGGKAVAVKKHNIVFRGLDKFFGFTERKTTILTEIFAGIILFFELVFFLYVNAFLMFDAYEGVTANLVGLNSLYYVMTLTSCVTTIAIGVLCNAPFAQAGSLGITMLIISLFGQYSGLTYSNVMAIGLIANLIYFVVMVIPVARRFVFDAVPDSVRKALPAAMGAFLIIYVMVQLNIATLETVDYSWVFDSLQDTGWTLGFFGISYISFSFSSLSVETFFEAMPFIMAIIAFVVMLILKRFKVKHATIISFGGAFVIYLLFYLFARLLPGDLADYRLFSFITDQSYGNVIYYSYPSSQRYASRQFYWAAFTEGFDFSAYTEAGGTTGGVVGIFIVAILSFLILGVSETGASVNACGYITGDLDENGYYKYINQPLYKKAGDYMNVYSVNALCSCLGCALGAGPVVVRAENTVAAHEGGKTGLTAIVAGLLLIIPLFTITLAGVMANGSVVYGMMAFVGLYLLTSLKNCDFSNFYEMIPFMLTVIIAGLTMNFCTAIIIGVVADVLMKALTFKFKQISVGNWVLAGVLLAAGILMLCL